MEIENRFEFPDKEDSLTLHQGLEALLAARNFFRNRGFYSCYDSEGSRVGSHFSMDYYKDHCQGIYKDTPFLSESGSDTRRIIFKDYVVMPAKDFTYCEDIDHLIGEIISRYGRFYEETSPERITINTFMANNSKYSLRFRMMSQKRKGFLAMDYDNNRWRLEIVCRLDKPLITKDEAEEYGMIKREFEELLGDGLGISQEEIQYNRRR